MSWAEIKKAVNSNIDMPLNTYLDGYKAFNSFYTSGENIGTGQSVELVSINSPLFIAYLDISAPASKRANKMKVEVIIDGESVYSSEAYADATAQSGTAMYSPPIRIISSFCGLQANETKYENNSYGGVYGYKTQTVNAMSASSAYFTLNNHISQTNNAGGIHPSVGGYFLSPIYCKESLKIVASRTYMGGDSNVLASPSVNLTYILLE